MAWKPWTRVWMRLWEAMLLQGLLATNLYYVWGCINGWIPHHLLLAYIQMNFQLFPNQLVV
jgi:hypothetical protein